MSGSRFVKDPTGTKPREVRRFWIDGQEEEGDWVDLLTALTFRETSMIEQKLIGAVALGGQAEAEPATSAANIQALTFAIKAWGGPGFTLEDGRIAAITEEAIGSMDPHVANRIASELRERLVRPPDFTQPPSPPTPTAGAEASTESA